MGRWRFTEEETMTERGITDRNLALEAVRVTEASALASARLMGRGDEEAADRAAAEAMFEALQILSVDGTVRIGERNTIGNARLAVGTKVGNGSGPKVDVALLPLEGPTIIARGEPNGISVIAMTQEGGFLCVPDVYMEKIAVGRDLPDDVVDLDAEPATNLKELAKAKKVAVSDLVVCTLDRPRHKEIIAKIRAAGARIMLMADGDVSGIIAASQPESVVDMYLGTGNAAQGVLAAAALTCRRTPPSTISRTARSSSCSTPACSARSPAPAFRNACSKTAGSKSPPTSATAKAAASRCKSAACSRMPTAFPPATSPPSKRSS